MFIHNKKKEKKNQWRNPVRVAPGEANGVDSHSSAGSSKLMRLGQQEDTVFRLEPKPFM
jgi:hypothetical protein